VEKITLIFSTNKGLASRLIRFVTWSRWSHVGIIIDPGHTIDATFTHGGVKIRPLADIYRDAKEYTFVDIYVPCAGAVRLAAHDELNKPYDWTALFGLWFKRDWQENDSWFCSEFVAYAFQKAGYPLFRDDQVHRITPDHLWKLAPGMTSGWGK